MILWRGRGRAIPSDELSQAIRREGLEEVQQSLNLARSELAELRAFQKDQVHYLARTTAESWTNPTHATSGWTFIDDPVRNQLSLDGDFAALLSHPLLQRLNRVKQLSFSYMVFPSATHTRLSHSLGVCKHVEMALDAIFRNDRVYSAGDSAGQPTRIGPEDRTKLLLKAKLAALLHDVGHGPFGHALDRFTGFIDPRNQMSHPDKSYSREYISRYLADFLPAGIAAADLTAILDKKRADLRGWDCLLADLIDSSLDVDRMDYLTRDAHMTGLSMGVTNAIALIERICPYREGDSIVLTYDSTACTYIEDFLRARDLMYRNCYDHARKLAAERILTRLVEALKQRFGVEIQHIMLLADDQLLMVLRLATVGSESERNLLDALMFNIEYEQIKEVPVSAGVPEISAWNQHLFRGRKREAYIESPTSWERAITEGAGLDPASSWRILVVVPGHGVSTPVESGAQILYREGDRCFTREVFEVIPRLKDHLKELMEQRQKIRVFCDSRLTKPEKARVITAANELFS
ncbi:MAG TPA: HD domain-containing protein [Candidatus Acidoferrum sp.]|nr:HD domain-containing protein [Candidatus Acidoferrum sp.]